MRIRLVVAFITLSLFIVGCSSNATSEQSEATSEEQSEEQVSEENNEESTEENIEPMENDEADEENGEAEEARDEAAQKLLEEQILSTMEESFSDSIIEFDEDEKTFSIQSTHPDAITDLMRLLEGEIDMEEWDTMVDSFVGVSESIKEVLGSGYIISFLNPVNPENTLLIVTDGVLIYDAMDEDVIEEN